MITTIRIAVAAVLALAVVPAAASAAAPPKGTYECEYLTSGRLFGLITLKSATTYAFNKKKSGTLKVSGRKVTFRSGPMKGVYEHAEVRKLSGTGTPYLVLFDGASFGHHDTDLQCLRRRS